jgi:N4-gp56 family major capsid protein
MANTSRSVISRENTEFYDRTLLFRAVPFLVHTKFAQVRDIPRNGGTNVIKFRRYGNLSAATTALVEGVTPAGSSLSVTDVTATVAQYGDYITITDVIDYESKDPVLIETAEILGDQMGDTLDQLTRDVIAAGSVVQYAGASSNSRDTVGSTDLIDVDDIKIAVRTLKNAKARKITRMINASTGIATEPVNASYIGLCHPNTTYTLKGLTGFTSVEKYASTVSVMEGEIGKIDEVRFIESTNCKTFTGGEGSITVYATIILGMDAYGITRISGEAVKNIVKPLGSAGTADPLEQRATSGWKATFVAKILNDAFMVRIEHAVAA